MALQSASKKAPLFPFCLTTTRPTVMKRFSILSFSVATLLAVAVFATPEDDAMVVSRFANSKIYKSDGSAGNFNGESTSDDGLRKVFNGKFDDNKIYMNTAKSYILIDLSHEVSNYVTKIVIGHKGNSQYSLHYTEDGMTWTTLAEEVTTADSFTYTVNHVATKVKYVFETVISWQPSLTEIQVWGIDPSSLGCLHPDQFLTEWEAVPGTANCTEFGIDQRQCTNCGAFFQRESLNALPLGHEYESILVHHGTSLAYGDGTNACKKCGDSIVFDEPIDLAMLGGAYTEGVIQFTDATASSIWHQDWGAGGAEHLLDGNWGTGYDAGWMASSLSHDEYAQFDFANAIDLTGVDISVPNHNHIVEFYSVEEGAEVRIGEWVVEKDTASNAAAYQRKMVEFRGVTLSSLRIRASDSEGILLWGKNIISICEAHPYGTVVGAGKSAAVRTNVIID